MVNQEFVPKLKEYHTNYDSNGKNEDENTTASNNDVHVEGLFEVNQDINNEVNTSFSTKRNLQHIFKL